MPVSLARELGQTNYLSAVGLFSNFLLTIVIILEFFTNEKVVPDIYDKLKNAELLIVKWDNIVETLPFVVFLYMY